MSLVGLIRPFVGGAKRWHFGLAAVLSFVGIGATIAPPTPEQVAARKARQAAEAAKEHQQIVEKAKGALNVSPGHVRLKTRSSGKLSEFEHGAVYAAAESRSCDKAVSAGLSDMSKPRAPIWYVDCANDNRFMIDQKTAGAALVRFKAAKLALSELAASCTTTTVAMCKATPAQRAAGDKEVEYVSACDLILDKVLVSPSSLDKHRWAYGLGSGDTVVVERPFDSQNGFGATVRGQYRCEIDASNSNITSFVVDGPSGRQQVI